MGFDCGPIQQQFSTYRLHSENTNYMKTGNTSVSFRKCSPRISANMEESKERLNESNEENSLEKWSQNSIHLITRYTYSLEVCDMEKARSIPTLDSHSEYVLEKQRR